MAVMPALLLAEMLSLFSVLWGPKCQILPTVPQSAVHPAQCSASCPVVLVQDPVGPSG